MWMCPRWSTCCRGSNAKSSRTCGLSKPGKRATAAASLPTHKRHKNACRCIWVRSTSEVGGGGERATAPSARQLGAGRQRATLKRNPTTAVHANAIPRPRPHPQERASHKHRINVRINIGARGREHPHGLAWGVGAMPECSPSLSHFSPWRQDGVENLLRVGLGRLATPCPRLGLHNTLLTHCEGCVILHQAGWWRKHHLRRWWWETKKPPTSNGPGSPRYPTSIPRYACALPQTLPLFQASPSCTNACSASSRWPTRPHALAPQCPRRGRAAASGLA